MSPIQPRSVLCLSLWLISAASAAQELEPRSYAPSPVDANFLAFVYAHSTGEVLFDPSLPFSDVSADLNAGVAAYAHTFPLFGRTAIAGIGLPYVYGDVEGNVGETRREAHRSGLGDARLRFGINLIGDPALTPAEFAKRSAPRTSVGASLVIVAPVGQYDPNKLVNIGSNRWAFKPELGIAHPLGRWYLEAYAGVWLFTENDAFYTGTSRREQDPLTTFQAHVSYTFRPRLWLAVDATHYSGGRTTVDDVERDDRQANMRIGATLSVPIGKTQSLKVTWSDGTSTRVGGDFQTFGIGWQRAWFNQGR